MADLEAQHWFQRMGRGGRMLWQIEDLIPTTASRVCGPGPRFKSRYRGEQDYDQGWV